VTLDPGEPGPLYRQAVTLGKLEAVVFDLADVLTVDQRLREVEEILRDAGLGPRKPDST